MSRNHGNEAFAVQTETATIRLERVLPGSAERLWSHLVDGDKRQRWFCGGDTLRKGGSATLIFQHSNITDEPTPDAYKEMDAGGIRSSVRVTEFDPPHTLAYTWPNGEHESEVRFELFPEATNVRLVITHQRLKNMEEQVNVSGGWHAHLDALEEVLEGRKPRGFWETVKRLDGEYTRRYGA